VSAMCASGVGAVAFDFRFCYCDGGDIPSNPFSCFGDIDLSTKSSRPLQKQGGLPSNPHSGKVFRDRIKRKMGEEDCSNNDRDQSGSEPPPKRVRLNNNEPSSGRRSLPVFVCCS